MELNCIKSKLKKSKEVIFDNKKIALTVVWVLFVLYQARGEWSVLSLNEKGDFLAGFFSPLAFLWLVLGYFQQGEELSLNTKALEWQIDELKESVEQQRILANIAQEERDAKILISKPIFKVSSKYETSGDNDETLKMTIEIYNRGFDAYYLKLAADSYRVKNATHELLKHGDRFISIVHLDSISDLKNGLKIKLYYSTGMAKKNYISYYLELPQNSDSGNLRVSKVKGIKKPT